jgi:hypothetical protein
LALAWHGTTLEYNQQNQFISLKNLLSSSFFFNCFPHYPILLTKTFVPFLRNVDKVLLRRNLADFRPEMNNSYRIEGQFKLTSIQCFVIRPTKQHQQDSETAFPFKFNSPAFFSCLEETFVAMNRSQFLGLVRLLAYLVAAFSIAATMGNCLACYESSDCDDDEICCTYGDGYAGICHGTCSFAPPGSQFESVVPEFIVLLL